MARKRYSPERVFGMLQEAFGALATVVVDIGDNPDPDVLSAFFSRMGNGHIGLNTAQ